MSCVQVLFLIVVGVRGYLFPYFFFLLPHTRIRDAANPERWIGGDDGDRQRKLRARSQERTANEALKARMPECDEDSNEHVFFCSGILFLFCAIRSQ